VDLFVGKWLNTVDAKGRVSVPAPLRKVIEARAPETKAIVLSKHDRDKALSGFDRTYLESKLAQFDRRAEADIQAGRDASDQYTQRTLFFASAEDLGIDGSGRIILSASLRRHARITDSAIFVGVGTTFEIWSPELALATPARPEMRDFAEELIAEREGRV
jgi:MraZ protein